MLLRELSEETGYDVQIVEKLFVKHDIQETYEVEVHYFRVETIDGTATIEDPRQPYICEIDWKSIQGLDELELFYPKDRDMIHDLLGQDAHM